MTTDAPGHQFACFHPVGASSQAVTGSPSSPQHSATATASEPDTTTFVNAEGTTGELLSVEHVVKSFDVTTGAVLQRKTGSLSAVADVSFALSPGHTFGLVGESGCGKSTIGRLIVGLEKPTSGRISIAGHDTAHLRGRQGRQLRKNMQLMFQDPYASLDPRMSVGDIVREPLAIQRVGSRREQRQRVRELLDEVGMPTSALDRHPHEFSGGQRQRIGLARALALKPKLVVADEPVSALDVSVQAQVLNVMRDLQERHRLSYVFISHDLGVVRHVSDRIGVMYLGKLVEVGPADDCYERPLHPYTKGLLDAIPIADPVRESAKDKLHVTGELPSAVHPPSGCRFRTRCPFAQEICATQEPELRELAPGRHSVACHFPLTTTGLNGTYPNLLGEPHPTSI